MRLNRMLAGATAGATMLVLADVEPAGEGAGLVVATRSAVQPASATVRTVAPAAANSRRRA